ncbi:MAG: phage portal protein [Oscillospiraceae bacterium]|nr:phage portal protein [Oscillospiraceae bacterium]MBR5260716.1 phage portal protein [Oscillospiraceae bacterium]
MKLFSGKGRAMPTAQLRSGERHPFTALDYYAPLGGGETEVYRSIREAVPVIDAAITKIVRLAGGFTVECTSAAAQKQLEHFISAVNVGRGQRGLEAFIAQYLDSMLTFGRAIGEIVTDGTKDIAAVICGNIRDVQVREGESALNFELCSYGANGRIEPLPYQDLLLFTPLSPEAENPYGVSLLRSMPFLVGILMRIYQSIGNNFERSGNVRYAVSCKSEGDALDRAYAKDRVEQIAREWSRAMQSGKNGEVRDFVTLGDVDIKVIGADNQMLDSESPVRQILEQLIAKTSVPPFLLGLSWSSTERMSSQQADMMTSELWAIRRSLTPVIEKICDLYLRMHGYDCDYSVVWQEIDLQDEVEAARASLYRAQAKEITGAAQ